MEKQTREPNIRLQSLLRRGGTAAVVSLALLAVARPALAHDNLGGDELSMAFWMFAFSVGIAMTGVFALYIAVRSGQFSQIEEAKYRILDNAPDLDDLAPAVPPAAPAPAPRPTPAPRAVPAVTPAKHP
jgi:nitrogen fixation-related uncharacterized protein